MARILVVDDEPNIRRTFGMVLRGEGFTPAEAGRGEEALAFVEREPVDLVVLDVRLPGCDGLETLARLKAMRPDLPVIMISGHATIATAVEATRVGAFDFLEKPCSRERLVLAVRNALRVQDLDREVRDLRRERSRRHLMVGESEAMRTIRDQIAVAAPTNARIMIRGESGTGKELVARALHEASARAGKPFVRVNCAAIPEELIESELFGAVKGSYTGATESRDGKFMQADGGTIFLDEIGDMSLRAQAKVLRALQEGEIEKVGGGAAIRVDVRVIAATNRDLEADARAGRFREDLFFRLNVVPVLVPPLRQRRDDIPLLAEHFLARYCDENGLPQRTLDADALALLRGQPWPGNVRELHNAVERLAIMSRGAVITPDDLRRTGVLGAAAGRGAAGADAGGDGGNGGGDGGGDGGMAVAGTLRPLDAAAVQALGGLAEARRRFESLTIAACLADSGGNVSLAARRLGIDRTNLHKKIQAYGLDADPVADDD